MQFQATIDSGGGNTTGIEVPDDVVAALDKGKRPPVVITVGGYSYRTTVARMHGRYLVPLAAEHRTAAGVAAGDDVQITIEWDDKPREVVVPDDLAAAFAAEPEARDTFDALSFTHRKEWVRWIEDAKREETRTARVAKTVSSLLEGKKAP